MALVSAMASRLATVLSPIPDSKDERASIASSQGTYAASVVSSISSSSDGRSSISEPALAPLDCDLPHTRRNEHLAVLLPKRLWKPDSQASHCDIFMCRKKFSMWERRHHCRKCGGIFCSDCSTRATALLDTSNLEFLNPPRDVPISEFDSPESPVVRSRVCDDCWDQIHGSKTPRTSPLLKCSLPISVVKDDHTRSSSSSVSSLVATPPDGCSPLARPSLRRSQTSPRISPSPLRANSSPAHSVVGVHVSDSELSLGELEAYPLKRASVICKATGGGRWEPKPAVNVVGYRIPGMKAEYELELEREEEEKRIRRANPIIKDGDIQVRVPRELEPRTPGGPFQFATF